MGITEETRLEAYIQRPVTRVNQIMQVLGDREMTSERRNRCTYVETVVVQQ